MLPAGHDVDLTVHAEQVSKERVVESLMTSLQAARHHADCAAAIRLAIFDLDGTLTARGTSVLQCLGAHFAFADLADDLVARHDRGMISNFTVSKTVATLLGHRHRDELVEALGGLNMRPDVQGTVRALTRRGVHCAVATLTFDFAADHVAQTSGFDVGRVMSTALEWTTEGRTTGYVRRAMSPQHKVSFMRRQCDELGISPRNVMVIGDSRADVPVMEMAGLAVGLDAVPEVQRVADVSLADLGGLVDAVEDRLPR